MNYFVKYFWKYYYQLRYALHVYKLFRKIGQQPELERLRDIYWGKYLIAELIPPNFVSLLGKAFGKGKDNHYRDSTQRPFLYFPFLTSKPFLEKDENAAFLERHVDVIREEFYAIESFCEKHPENLVKDGKWDTYKLYHEGMKYEVNCTRCPETTRIIEQLPHCCNWIGLAYFSVLQPGVNIPPHYGPTNGRLRYHLGLEVPENVWIQVKDDVRSWILDKCLIFDDSFEHEVFHKGQARRVVLILDLWHPELSKEERKILEESILKRCP